jgi:hypothetical protein
MKLPTDLYILAVEVTQGIQCMGQPGGYPLSANSLELDADKPIAVRVYVGHDGDPQGLSTIDLPTIPIFHPALGYDPAVITLNWGAFEQAMLDALPLTAAVALSESESVSAILTWATDLWTMRNCGCSANFIIPPERLGKPGRPKVLLLNAEVKAPPQLAEGNTANNSLDLQLGGKDSAGFPVPGGLKPHEPLTIRWVPIDYQVASSSAKGFPDMAAAGRASEWMANTFPMRIRYEMASSWMKLFKNPFYDLSSSNNLLLTLGEMQYLMKPQPDVLVGWLPAGANGYVSCYGLGTNFPPVAWAVQRKNESLDGTTIAHEVGHTQGIEHPSLVGCPSKIVECGFDLTAGNVIRSDQSDFMCAGGGDWMSPYAWTTLLGQACSCPRTDTKTDSPAVLRSAKRYLGVEQDAAVVSGWVNRSGSAGIDAIFRLESRGPFPLPDSRGEYCLVFETEEGEVQPRYCFDLQFRELESGRPTDRDGFCLQLPLPTGAKRILLRRDSRSIAQQSAMPTAPALRITHPSPGPVGGEHVVVEWTAVSPTDHSLEYCVLFSPDGGESWSPVAIRITESRIDIPTNHLRGGDNCVIRILGSDGFQTAQADSPRFSLPPMQPASQPVELKRYLGNVKSRKVHDLWGSTARCQIDQIYKKNNGVVFSWDSLQQAKRLHFSQCAHCIAGSDSDFVD